MTTVDFPVGKVVGPSDLVGREPAIQDLTARLMGGQSILIAGPRRIGKTSVASEVLRRLKEQGHPTGIVDFFSVSSKKEFAEALADSCLSNLTGLSRSLNDLRQWIKGHSPGSSSIKGKLGPVFEVALTIAGPAKEKDDEALLLSALDIPRQVAAKAGRKFVVCLDEFQEITRVGADVLKPMRSAITRQEDVVYLFLGSQESLLRDLFVKKNEPFYRFAVEWNLPPVSTADWEEYLARKYGSLGVMVDPVALRHVVETSGGHPLDTMLLANEVLHLARETGSASVSLDLVRVAFERTMVALTLAFEETWRTLGLSAQRSLKKIVRGESLYAGEPRSHPTDVKRGLEDLLGRGILLRVGKGRYLFQERMFEEYIRRLLN